MSISPTNYSANELLARIKGNGEPDMPDKQCPNCRRGMFPMEDKNKLQCENCEYIEELR